MLSAQGPFFGAAPAHFGGWRIRTYVYIDGFNLYYGAVKGTPYKWLNLVALVRQLVPSIHDIVKVKYFTARVSGAADADAPRRQQAYLDALSTLPEVEFHFGSFLSKTVWRPIVNLPVAGATIHSQTIAQLPEGTYRVSGGSLNGPSSLPVGTYPPRHSPRSTRRKAPRPLPDALIAEVHVMEEKGSDVNLAAHLLNDAWRGSFDAAVVVSNDTDLVTPIRMVSVDRGKSVFVVCPGRWQMDTSKNPLERSR
ncbi:MAG: NYN domain-containing protein [Alphaproteobacteria bacterium]